MLLQNGGTLELRKHEAEMVFVFVTDTVGAKVHVALTPAEALVLIEFLAIAARPHTGAELIDLPQKSPRELAL
jgi:hypothetical protein